MRALQKEKVHPENGWNACPGRWNYKPDSEFREESDDGSEESSDERSSHSSK